jgi:hypothetical protein
VRKVSRSAKPRGLPGDLWVRVALVSRLASARLLTLDGDAHTAYTSGNPCIGDAVNSYLLHSTVPLSSRPGTDHPITSALAAVVGRLPGLAAAALPQVPGLAGVCRRPARAACIRRVL